MKIEEDPRLGVICLPGKYFIVLLPEIANTDEEKFLTITNLYYNYVQKQVKVDTKDPIAALQPVEFLKVVNVHANSLLIVSDFVLGVDGSDPYYHPSPRTNVLAKPNILCTYDLRQTQTII